MRNKDKMHNDDTRHSDVDWMRCRAIFLWLCSKDLSKLNFSSVEKGSPEEILMNLQRGLTTYARVYETLCRSVCLSLCLSVFISVCLSVPLAACMCDELFRDLH